MKETKKTAMTFDSILKLQTASCKTLKSLLSRTERWLHTKDAEEFYSEIIPMIDCFLEQSYEKIKEDAYSNYHSLLISELEEDLEKNWDLIQQINDGFLPFEK